MAYVRFFSALTETLSAIAISGGYVSLFVIMLLEGVPIIGILIPGHVAIVGAGFLASVGVFNLWIVLLVGTVSAIAGDYASYLLGRHFGWPLIDRMRRLFFIKDTHIEKAKRLLDAHTGKALIAGRFNPVTRGIMPFLVGANRAPAGSFWVYNTIGAVLWITSSVVLGYALGLGYHVAEGAIGSLALVALVISALTVWGYRFVNIRFHIFRRYELFTLILNVISLFVLARMIQDIISLSPFMAPFDIQVSLWAEAIAFGPHSMWISSIAVAISAVFSIAAVTAYGTIGSIYLAYRKKWRRAALTIMSLGACAVSVGWMKEIFARVRPHDMIITGFADRLGLIFDQSWLSSDPSFPSGHSVFAGAFFFLLAYHLVPHMRSWVTREIMIVLCVLGAVAVGLSRIILNVHWASDVIAGWALGVFCATASVLFVRYVAAVAFQKATNA